ncbi:eukaryotic translation initiation factor 2C 2 [Coprinopsis cinerea okayama7|uniref:Eukaryotic translation initiation factor 2C 2 n=1 Tax=Coprinopsis cinerea (strain Okayama-7 / 130 / ATCC MYA-4618 / FGSC 9003) TaxID=240176 RepID=A8P6A7_COPC7|nr:eukaryotic translation initiation factor 2C 2 [Coprinopsis cinerea okayama7\|eukprot:XP_001839116.2 eukaryotic translation initiation factor 2C 2 [Coprinopsis cinerea okayama7\
MEIALPILVAADPPIMKLPLARAHEIFEKLKAEEQGTFQSFSAWFDGRAIMYTTAKLPLGPSDSKEFAVPMGAPGGKKPKIFKVTITKTNFVQGRYAHDETIQMGEMAINTALRTVVAQKYTCNRRSFFTAEGRKAIGGGLEVRRGFFHSYRPSINGYLVNFDVATTVFYEPGPLISACLKFFGPNDLALLDPKKRFKAREKKMLEKFFYHVKLIPTRGSLYARGKEGKVFTFRKFSAKSASEETFDREKDGVKKKVSVATYFKELGIPLKYPGLVCAQVSDTALVPIELLDVAHGQFARMEITPDQTKAVVEFSTMRPQQRFEEIQKGFEVVAYGQSEYLRGLGITVDSNPIEVDARVLQPPAVKYGFNKNANVANGKWNSLQNKFVQPAQITGFVVAIFESQQRFPDNSVIDMAAGFVKAARDFGVVVSNPSPVYHYMNRPRSEADLVNSLKALGKAYVERSEKGGKKEGPTLIFAVLPPNSGDIYTGVKRFGDVTMGIATQCLLSNKCKKGNHQYWANVTLKVNVKLGGINFYPELRGDILDPAKPTIIMGADAIHPPPGVRDKPSVTALVSSIDSKLARYVATSRVQKGSDSGKGGREIILDMEDMCVELFEKWKDYQSRMEKRPNSLPSRLIMYRDGVSEGEFQQVLDHELPKIKKACKTAKINPKITLIIVGKRHHHRGKPKDLKDGDSISHNLPAGTTIDTDIVHPLQNDYYQWTHGGLLGTSRPGHYTVLYDDNGLTPDGIQSLSFGLAHSFARTTRSVSIPAPVYYADIVCERKTIYMDYEKLMSDQGSQATSGAGPTLEDFKAAYSRVHAAQSNRMYFMVSGAPFREFLSEASLSFSN